MTVSIRIGLTVFFFYFAHAIKDSLFSKKPICDVVEREQNHCSAHVSSARSLLECLTFCGKDEMCLGASVTNTLVCYIHKHCPQVTRCGGESNDHIFYAKNCYNNGEWDSARSSCDCRGGWVGPMCDKLPRSCDDLIASGYQTGSHKVTLDLSDKGLPNIEIFCWVRSTEPTFSTVTLMRNGGKVRHDKDWTKYALGYSLSASNFWLGLNNWHVLSQAGYNTLTFKAFFYISGVCEYEWNYYNFRLSGEKDNFAFSFDYSANVTRGCVHTIDRLEDCFGPLQNISFSTWDVDNDLDIIANCAGDNGAGWWYSGCQGPCHLLGWGQGYKDMVPSEHLIDLIGLDMDIMRQYLMSMEMYLETPSV